MKLLVDINLSPQWAEYFRQEGYPAVHWSTVGSPRAPDTAILHWARDHEYLVFTHDLDFSRLLALTHAKGPSVFQIRAEDILPVAIGGPVIKALRLHAEALKKGAIVVLDSSTLRARILPI